MVIMLVASGGYALLRMPRREDPKIHVRTGVVAAFYPGASAAEVENQVTQKSSNGSSKSKVYGAEKPTRPA